MRRASRGGLCLALAAALLLCGPACGGLRVRTDHDREADFSRYRSFDWLQPPPGASEAEGAANPFTHNSLLDKRVRAAVESELAQRGFVRSGDAPSFRVHYHVLIRERLAAWRSYDAGYPWGPHGPLGVAGDATVGITQFREGTLVLDVIDPARDQLTWRGWAVGSDRDGHYGEREIRRAVREILARFPPAGG